MKIIEPAVKMKSIDETASIVPLNKFRSWLRVEKKEKIIPWRTVEKSYRDLSGKEIKHKLQ